jgi:arginine:ornithine antiporter / lysine permease
MTTTESRTEQPTDKLSLPTPTAMVVVSMIGSDVFLLPRRFETETGVPGAIIAWTIAGTGMLMLAFVFQRLAVRKPDLGVIVMSAVAGVVSVATGAIEI